MARKFYPKRIGSGRWIYLPLDESMKAVGMEEVDTYILRLQNNVAWYIATRLILELCMVEYIRPVVRVSMIWWEQSRLELGHRGLDMDTKMEGEEE